MRDIFFGVTENSLVFTDAGYKKIKDLKTQDNLLTHNVKNTITYSQSEIKQINKISSLCVDRIECDENMKFLVTAIEDGKFCPASWVECKNLTTNHYLITPINNKAEVPVINGFELNSSKLWFEIGDIVYKMSQKLRDIDAKYDNKVIKEIVKSFVDEKRHVIIPSYIIDMPVYLLKSFLDGFIQQKQSKSKSKRLVFIGKRNFMYCLGLCIAKAYKQPYHIKNTFLANKCKIELFVENNNGDIVYSSNNVLHKILHIDTDLMPEQIFNVATDNKDAYCLTVNNCIASTLQNISQTGEV